MRRIAVLGDSFTEGLDDWRPDGTPRGWADRVADILRRAKLKHRGPNQARHTFASQLLSNYVPDTEVARFMGYTGPDMVRRNYGKFIPEDAPDRSDEISSRLGFKTENSNPDIREEVKR